MCCARGIVTTSGSGRTSIGLAQLSLFSDGWTRPLKCLHILFGSFYVSKPNLFSFRFSGPEVLPFAAVGRLYSDPPKSSSEGTRSPAAENRLRRNFRIRRSLGLRGRGSHGFSAAGAVSALGAAGGSRSRRAAFGPWAAGPCRPAGWRPWGTRSRTCGTTCTSAQGRWARLFSTVMASKAQTTHLPQPIHPALQAFITTAPLSFETHDT